MPETTNLPIQKPRPSGLKTTEDLRQHLKATIHQSVTEYLAQYRRPVDRFAWISNVLRLGHEAPQDESTREVGKIFFSKWFTDRDFFLFRKNLTVTNIQYAELLALMRTHINTDVRGEGAKRVDIHQLQFLSYDDFVPLIDGLLGDFNGLVPGETLTEDQLLAAVDHLLPVLRRTVLLERFYGSCIAFLPKFMRFNLEQLCGESGYVHSCGRVLYVRNIEKTSRLEVRTALDRYFDRVKFSSARDRPVRFHVYTHDDSTPRDRHHAEELRHGLDSVKIHLDKFHIGNEPLTTLLPELEEEFRDRIVVVGPPGHDASADVTDQSHSLWMIVDRSPAAAQPGFGPGSRFLICYDQWWRNRNPLHALDENKPAWVGPVTIPHALLGAMINITRPWRRPPSYTMRLADPFGGSGSTLLETLKFDESHVQCDTADLDGICELLASDNAAILAASVEDLDAWIGLVRQVAEAPTAEHDITDTEKVRMQASVAELQATITVGRQLSKRADAGSDGLIPMEVVEQLRRSSPRERLVFYLFLKAQSRHLTDIARGKEPPTRAVSAEATRLAKEMESLRDLRRLMDEAPVPVEDAGAPTPLRRFYDEWSLATTFAVDASRTETRMRQGDVRGLPERMYDVVVADPPYGYNTDLGATGLAALYRDAFTAMLRALKSEGQLVLALPDKSLSGRTTPTFTHKEFCIRLLLALAEEQGRQVYSIADAFPSTRRAQIAPYYWESERALRRAILHLRVRDRPFEGEKQPAGGEEQSAK